MKENKLYYITIVIIAIIVLVLIVIGILVIRHYLVQTAEISLGLVIVFAISVLLVLLFLLAVGFSWVNLTDPKQALGLPEGSIRAIIALFLIMVFVIFGIFFFRTVAFPSGRVKLPGLTWAQIAELPVENLVNVVKSKDKPETFDVTIGVLASEAGSRLAQQLITTVGTLVVAVAGFYFGTRAVAAARGIAVPSLPVIRRINPDKVEYKEDGFGVTVLGKNFQSPKEVRLAKDSTKILGSDITWSATKIQCTFKFKNRDEAIGIWALVVVNEDGEEDQLDTPFTVTNPPPTVSNITPISGQAATGSINITDLAGTGFIDGAEVRLKRFRQTDINATDVKIVDPTQITCKFDLTNKKPGEWGVVVINPDEQESKIDTIFEVK
jgi:hypothetical protein